MVDGVGTIDYIVQNYTTFWFDSAAGHTTAASEPVYTYLDLLVVREHESSSANTIVMDGNG